MVLLLIFTAFTTIESDVLFPEYEGLRRKEKLKAGDYFTNTDPIFLLTKWCMCTCVEQQKNRMGCTYCNTLLKKTALSLLSMCDIASLSKGFLSSVLDNIINHTVNIAVYQLIKGLTVWLPPPEHFALV